MSRQGESNWTVVRNHRNKGTGSVIVGVLICFGLKINDDLSKLLYWSGNAGVEAFKTLYSEVVRKGWYKPQTWKSMFEMELEQKKFVIQKNTGSTVSERMYGCTFSCCRGIMNRLLYPELYGKNIVLFYKIGDHYMLSLENTFLHSESNYPRNFPNGIKGDINESMKSHVYGKAFEAFLTLTPKELEVRDENNKKKEESMNCNNFTNILLHKTLKTSNNTIINFLMTADIDLFAERVTNPIDLKIYEVKSTGYDNRYPAKLKDVSQKNRKKWAIQMNSVNCKKLITIFHNGKYEPINICENSSSDLNIIFSDRYIERENQRLANYFEEFIHEYETIPDDGSIRCLRIIVEKEKITYSHSSYKSVSNSTDRLITKCIQQLQESMKFDEPVSTAISPSDFHPKQNKMNVKTNLNPIKTPKTAKKNPLITIAENDKKTIGNQHSNKNLIIDDPRGFA
uniref:Decapping nuclease n=1 Tax=Rhabditophanes sp. KR3021 TaxID=114890 RepID=A0AC35UF20_9BILA